MARRSNYDSAWKDALDSYFPQFMALFWPALHARIAWAHAPVFLDKELRAIMRSTARGRRHVDKLVSLRLLDGQDALVLIHVEIQAGGIKLFAQRMFTYHVLLRQRHPRRTVVSLAVLTDQGKGASSMSYAYACWGTTLAFTFPVIRLEAWRPRMDELLALAPRNPFAVVVLAQLQANATRAGGQRLARKTELVKGLYRWGFSRDNVVQLFRIIDAMVGLPEALEPAFEQAVRHIEEETQMTYVSSIERVQLKREREAGRQEGEQEGMQKGREEGFAQLLAAQATAKFGALPDWARLRLAQADRPTLNRWAVQILDAQRVEDVFA